MANDYEEIDDFLMGGGTKSCSFLKVGDSYEGEIVSLRKQQRTTPQGELKTWKSGEPMMEIVAVLATEDRDPDIEDDSGVRGLYISYRKLEAVKDAIKEVQKTDPDVKGLRVGGWLGMEFTKQDRPKQRGHSGTKYFEAWYDAPEPGAETDDLTGDDDDVAEEPAPPPRRARGAAKAAPVKATRGRAKAAPEPDDDADEPAEEAPTRGRGRTAPKKAAPARGRGRKPAADVDEYTDDDGAGF